MDTSKNFNQVCFRSDHFLLFVVIMIGIIGWVIYQLFDRYRRMNVMNSSKMQDLYENITEIIKNDKNAIQVSNEEKPDQREVYVPQRTPEPVLVNYRPPIDPYRYGDYGNYQLVGYVYPQRHPDQMFRLLGRRYNHTRYEYYVVHPYTDIKIPIQVKNDWELNTGDHVHIPGFQGHYVVYIYDVDRPI